MMTTSTDHPPTLRRAFLIVLDSVGIGEAPDADRYNDVGANTLANLAEAVGGIHVPCLERLGLGNIPPLLPGGKPIAGVAPVDTPSASFGALQEVSQGKDTTTGHWEMAGLHLEEGFYVFPPGPPSFPDELIEAFVSRTGRPIIGNLAASGTTIIADLGERQMREGCWIVYTSGDSVFQIAAHEEVIPLEELYQGCEVARELCNPLTVGRVIARPYVGTPGAFTRTDNRKDYSYPLPELTVLDRLSAAGIPVITVGKLDDVFAHRGMTRTCHAENNADAQTYVHQLIEEEQDGFIFVNLIDFDMRYGHRRDPKGYATALEKVDGFLETVIGQLGEGDLLMITADHGNDPTYSGTDHTREFVPLLMVQPGQPARNLGIRQGFFDIAQTLATGFGLEPGLRGVSFLR